MKCYSQLFCLSFSITTSCCRMTTQGPVRRRYDSSFCSRTMRIVFIGLLDPLTCRQSSMFGTFWPVCTTESSSTKNTPSFGRSLARGVEKDTPATYCQTHQEYASSLFDLNRCNSNSWTYAILTVTVVRFYW